MSLVHFGREKGVDLVDFIIWVPALHQEMKSCYIESKSRFRTPYTNKDAMLQAFHTVRIRNNNKSLFYFP